jgi:TonB-linked SusC/RagA family outer membrane protein
MKWRLLLTIFVLPCLLLLRPAAVQAQTRTVTGKVTDSKDGTPIAGASVTVKGGKRGAVTDTAGNFTLKVSAAAKTLEITSVGYGAQEVSLDEGTAGLRVQLLVGSSDLNDVVVIGYGTQQKKDLTGAISSIGTKDFQTGSITSPDQLIMGKVAGVSVTTNGGQPGNSSTIRIRGLASLNGNQDPLIVLDGVPLPAMKWVPPGSTTLTSTIAGIADPLSLINPDDIENITILKDASASAIYGSRASAGVLLVTTKMGRGGDMPAFNFNTSETVGVLGKEISVLNAGQMRAYVTAAAAADPASYNSYVAMMGTANTNWQKQIFHSAFTTNDNLSMSGSLKDLPYRISVGYHDESGILQTDQLQRETMAIHLAPRLFNDHLRVELNVIGAAGQSRFANQGAIGAALSMDPTQSVFQKGGSIYGDYFEWTNPIGSTTLNAQADRNPVALLKQNFNLGTTYNSIGNAKLDYKFPLVPELHAILNLGYDVATGKGSTVVPNDAAQDYNNQGAPGSFSQYRQNNTYTMSEFSLNYVKDLKAIKSNINAMATYGFYNNLINQYNYASFNGAGDVTGTGYPTFPNTPSENTLISYVGRVIYTYDNKYILTASIRDDGSSRFSPQNRWGIFPAIAGAWRISQENFLRNTRWLTDLKLRGSYGLTGNQDGISDYSYIPSYSLSANSSLYPFGETYYNPYSPAAYFPNLKWEQTASTNVGLDWSIFNNRISGTVDYYYNNVSNLLNSVFIPVGSNFTNEGTINVGSMTNQGVEVNLNTVPVKTKDFTWNLNVNFTYQKNKITKLTTNGNDTSFYGDQVGAIGGGTGNNIQIQTVGYSAYSFFVLQQVYGKNGMPLEGQYVDRNRDGVISQPYDFYHYKTPFAPVTLGLSTSVAYRKWSLSVAARASIGNYMYNNVSASLGVTKYILSPYQYIGNATTDIYKTGFVNNQYFSDYYVQNASFVKIDNIGIGYNMGKLSNRTTLRLSANCQNAFIITKYTGQDPEVYGGIDNNVYPRPRNFTIGANLGF